MFYFFDLGTFQSFILALFFIGISGIAFNQFSIIIMLMSIELMLLAINISFITFSVFLEDLVGQLLSIFILTVAASESAIGLAILVVHHRLCGTISVEYLSLLKG